MAVVVLILILCVLFAVWSWMKPRHPSPPLYPGALPFIRHAHLFIGDSKHMWNVYQKLFEFCQEKGGVIEFRLGLQSWYVITDPEDSLTVANTCLDKPYVYSFGKELYGNGLVTAKASTWKIHRKLLNPSFNLQVLNPYVSEFNVQARALITQFDSHVGKDPFDVDRYLVKSSLRTVCRTSLGLKTEDQNMIDEDYAQAAEDYFYACHDRFQKFWLHLYFVYAWSSLKVKQDGLMKVMKGIMNEVIRKRKSEFKDNDSSNNDTDSSTGKFKPVLNQMLELADKQHAFTDVDIREHLDTFVAATYDTTSTAIMYILLLIGSYSEVQQRLYKELREVLGDEDRDVTQQDLVELVYLEAVLKESLRLYPPVPAIGRSIDRDVKLKNYTLQAGSACVLSLYGINRHPVWGPDADQFRPERWLDPASLPENLNAFATFSIGRRNCIGKSYGCMAMKTTLAHLCRRYHIFSDVNNITMKCDLFLKPVSGHHIGLKMRT